MVEPDCQLPPEIYDFLSDKQYQAAMHIARGGDDGPAKKNGIVWWKVGEGKTRIALAWMYSIAAKPRPLIICSPGAFRQWQDEIDLLKMSGKIRPKFISYGMLSRKARPLILDFEKYNCLVVDELWLYKNYKSKRSQMINQITSRLPSLGLSGSMVTARNIEDLYGQAKAMSLDQKVAPNITNFRSRFCIEITNHFTGFLERYPKRHAVEQIQRSLVDNIHVYFPKDVREIKNIPVNVEPSLEQRKIKRELAQSYYYEHQHEKYGFQLEVKSAAALLVKLQQISDGFLRDQEGRTIYIESRKTAKLKRMCAELLDAGERILVWVAFRETANLLHKFLPYPSIILSSEYAFDHETWRKGKAKICLATVGSGSSLNDFANLRYALFYSTRFSHVQMQQAKGRTNRKSSTPSARYYYYLQSEGFPDREVYRMIEESRSTEEMVIAITNMVLADSL